MPIQVPDLTHHHRLGWRLGVSCGLEGVKFFGSVVLGMVCLLPFCGFGGAAARVAQGGIKLPYDYAGLPGRGDANEP